MGTIERLKQQKEFYTTNNVTAVPVSVLFDLWHELPKLLAVVEAAEAAVDEADPRKYGDLSPKMQELAFRLRALL